MAHAQALSASASRPIPGSIASALTEVPPAAAAGTEVGPHAGERPLDPLLVAARERAARDGLPYAGSVSPQEAWALASAGAALIVDVRTAEEYKYVGHVPGSPLVQWQSGAALVKNPRFARELAARAGKDEPILLLCRSGKRSAAAAEAATRAGFQRVFNIREGFEGDISPDGQRGTQGGWRHHGLPWTQD